MAHAIPWGTAFEASPVSTDQMGETPDFIRATRDAVSERIRQEHSFRLADTSNDNQGKHLQGSARAFVNDTNPATPATLPTDTGEYYIGRLIYKPTTKQFMIYKDSTDTWVDLTVDANGDFEVTRDLIAGRQLVSEVADGTPPLVVTSTTEVANLRVADAAHADDADLAAVATKLAGINMVVHELGPWNMDTTSQLIITLASLGISDRSKIVTIAPVPIIPDNANAMQFLNGPISDVVAAAGTVYSTTTAIVLHRFTGLTFDNAIYSSTAINRGWITIWYVD